MVVIPMRERADSTARSARDQVRIRVKGVIKQYGPLEVFRDVGFDVGEQCVELL